MRRLAGQRAAPEQHARGQIELEIVHVDLQMQLQGPEIPANFT